MSQQSDQAVPASRPEDGAPPLAERSSRVRWVSAAAIAAAFLGLGAAGGVGAAKVAQRWQPVEVMLMQPLPIGQMADGATVAVKGQVSEIFGNKFIVQDDSGRALIETGPRGEGGGIVEKGDTVTVQGRFERGFVHAQAITRADGRTVAFAPPRPPHPKKGRPRPDEGPDRFDRGPEPLPGAVAPPPPAPRP